MIDIVRFREYLLEVQAEVNECQSGAIAGCELAVKEEHMTKKLKDKTGVLLCANYPDAETDAENKDSSEDTNQVILFVVEKVPAGKWTDEEELLHYAGLQRIMNEVRRAVLEGEQACGTLAPGNKLRTEWEYGIFGGFNGLSIGLTIKDYD